jgi:hypothetical protein
MASLNFSKYIGALVVCMFFTIHTQAQDSSAAQNFKYVVLTADRANNAIPDYQKLKARLEEGIKNLLVDNKVPMPKNPKEVAGKNVQACDILTCTYALTYATGMMFNAKIKCTLTFTDCHKNEVYTISAGKMTGAVAGADVYLKVFEKLITPGLMKHLATSQ